MVLGVDTMNVDVDTVSASETIMQIVEELCGRKKIEEGMRT